MNFKTPSKKTTNIVAVVIVVALFLFSAFEARGIVLGGTFRIESPKNGDVVSNRIIKVSGKSRDLVEVTLNGRKLALHENGDFSNALVLKEGYNEIIIEGKDRFGRNQKEVLFLMHDKETSLLENKSVYEKEQDQKDSGN